MIISILTLFPEMFQGPFGHSILKHAQAKQLVTLQLINIRDFAADKHHTVDDTPYGGGVGMVLRVDVIHAAIEFAKKSAPSLRPYVLLTSAKGVSYTQALASSFADKEHLIIVCGHYEGVDERILAFVDQEISIGSYVLTGGEIPAMVIVDSVTRLVEGVLKPDATKNESFSLTEKQEILLEYPHYTKPQVYKNMEVPHVLLSGDHKKIQEWRREQAAIKTEAMKQ